MADEETMAVLQHHAAALVAGDLDEIMADYADDAVFISHHTGVLAGAEAIRGHFATPSGLTNIVPTTVAVHGDYVYVCWTADGVPLGTDTLVVRDGRIVFQTVAIHRP
jgi:ketosteroid isomerase-like protein